jgi:hypothetical protein
MTNKSGKEIKCRNCGRKFVFTDEEKAFYDSKNLQEPKSCFNCRNIAKIARKETINILKRYGFLRFDDGDTELGEGEEVVELG